MLYTGSIDTRNGGCYRDSLKGEYRKLIAPSALSTYAHVHKRCRVLYDVVHRREQEARKTKKKTVKERQNNTVSEDEGQRHMKLEWGWDGDGELWKQTSDGRRKSQRQTDKHWQS